MVSRGIRRRPAAPTGRWGLKELLGHEIPSPEAPPTFLKQLHGEEKIENAKPRRGPEQIAFIPEEPASSARPRGRAVRSVDSRSRGAAPYALLRLRFPRETGHGV
jgi:hypothetical protein